eukprot:jgi/Mesen1/2971/ME000176S02010
MAAIGVRTAQPKRNARKAQAAVDASLQFNFEEQAKIGCSGDWDYLSKVLQQNQAAQKTPNSGGMDNDAQPAAKDVDVAAYLQHVQRPGFIQTHGTLLLLEEKTMKVLASAENVWEYLDQPEKAADAPPEAVLECDARALFTPKRSLYAILHRIEEGIVVDLELQGTDGQGEGEEGAEWVPVDAHDRASASIAKLQGVSDMDSLCNTLVQEVKALTGYDRVMVYKFHEDQHGEVIAEAKEDHLAPLIGLHYPANDVPQANRTLFVKVRLRLISDTDAGNVNIIQHSSLKKPIALSHSTMRGVAGCHKEYCKNMGCTATLVMAVVTSTGPERERHLWGLVCCHHHSGPRTLPYPQRSACDFLLQAFALQLGMELEVAEDAREKHVMHMQAVLCGMLTRDAPLGLIRQSPNIQDLVPADGAVLMHNGKLHTLGTTPTNEQCADILAWLLKKDAGLLKHGVFTTNCLDAEGYEHAEDLAPLVCGLAATVVSDKNDFLMWFRSGISKRIKWAGHKETHAVKEGASMHPRVSFDAFLEVAKQQSPPWQDAEVDAMQGLKLIVRDALPHQGPQQLRVRIQTQLNQEKLSIQKQLVHLAQNLQTQLESAKTPIIGLSGSGVVLEWNTRASVLTNRPKEEVMSLNFIESILAEESREDFREVVELVAEGEELGAMDLCLLSRATPEGPLDRRVHLLVSLYAHHDSHGNLFGVRMVGQDITALKVLSGEYVVPPEEARASLDQSDVLVFAIDAGGRVSEWNSAMERMTGMKRDAVMGKRLVGDVLRSNPMIMVPEGQDSLVHFEIALCQALNGQSMRNHEFHFQTWDGKQMDTLMHIISRCIRNPLNGILSSITFMQDTDMTAEQNDLVNTTASCGTYLRRIVDDVLDLSRIEEGKLEVEAEPFSLLRVLEAVVNQEATIVFDKRLQFFCTADPACAATLVSGDRQRVQQIVANFARNAVEYTREGWVEIKLQAQPPKGAPGGGRLHFQFVVSDSGKGLSAEELSSVFTVPRIPQASDAEGSGMSSFGGAGLGLVVCQQLSSLMGGTVRCQSKPGVGSCFTLELELPTVPLAAKDDEEEIGDGLFRSRAKGVIYSTVGEWSSPQELAIAATVSPTVQAAADAAKQAVRASPPPPPATPAAQQRGHDARGGGTACAGLQEATHMAQGDWQQQAGMANQGGGHQVGALPPQAYFYEQQMAAHDASNAAAARDGSPCSAHA